MTLLTYISRCSLLCYCIHCLGSAGCTRFQSVVTFVTGEIFPFFYLSDAVLCEIPSYTPAARQFSARVGNGTFASTAKSERSFFKGNRFHITERERERVAHAVCCGGH